MIPADVRLQLNEAHAVGNYRPLLGLIPYAGLIGIECERQGDDLLFVCRRTRTTLAIPCCPRSMAG